MADSIDDEGNSVSSRDYEVGYGKPPKATRWPPGQSGNPRGPKKGSRGLKKDLHRALNAKHSIKVNGKVISGTTQELAMYTLASRAAAGDIRAIRQLVELVMQIFGPDDRGRERRQLSSQDQELLERLLGRIESEGNGGEADEADAAGPGDKGTGSDEPSNREENGNDA